MYSQIDTEKWANLDGTERTPPLPPSAWRKNCERCSPLHGQGPTEPRGNWEESRGAGITTLGLSSFGRELIRHGVTPYPPTIVPEATLDTSRYTFSPNFPFMKTGFCVPALWSIEPMDPGDKQFVLSPKSSFTCWALLGLLVTDTTPTQVALVKFFGLHNLAD